VVWSYAFLLNFGLIFTWVRALGLTAKETARKASRISNELRSVKVRTGLCFRHASCFFLFFIEIDSLTVLSLSRCISRLLDQGIRGGARRARP
jgi:hypothetical protein